MTTIPITKNGPKAILLFNFLFLNMIAIKPKIAPVINAIYRAKSPAFQPSKKPMIADN